MKGAAEVIEENLEDDKVLGRTRVLRNTLDQERGGADSEIFDDTDFYHQILRDVVDARKG